MLGNLLCVVSAVISMIINFPCLVIGRFIYGVAAGSFSVFCPKFISEMSPVEVSGQTGSAVQLSVTLGIFICFATGLSVKETDDQRFWFIEIMFGVPIVISIVNVFLLVTVFNYDSPPMMLKKGETEKLNKYMSKLYRADFVERKINSLKTVDEMTGDEA